MEVGKLSVKISEAVKKYRYPILVLLAGLLLMMLPGKQAEKSTPEPELSVTQPQKQDLAQELQSILMQIKGVGKVQVLLTQAAGELYQYQQDEKGDGWDTVIITDENRNQNPILSQVLPPTYLGAVIVCQGAGTPEVKLAVVEAVSKATGLSSDKITVLKMK